MNIDYITIQLNKLDNVAEFVTLGILLAGLVAAFYYIRNRKRDEALAKLDQKTIIAYKENNEALEARLAIVESEVKICFEQHQATEKVLAKLKTQLKVYDSLTLVPKQFIDDMETKLNKLGE